LAPKMVHFAKIISRTPKVGKQEKSRLDARRVFSWSYGSMKRLILAVLAGAAVVATGCVSTVNGSHSGAIWFGNDQFNGRYNRSVDQVYAASVRVVNQDGALIAEYFPHDSTNTVKSLAASVNNRDVYIRVEGISTSPEVTQVTVQARTHHGTSDAILAHELEKEIALALVR